MKLSKKIVLFMTIAFCLISVSVKNVKAENAQAAKFINLGTRWELQDENGSIYPGIHETYEVNDNTLTLLDGFEINTSNPIGLIIEGKGNNAILELKGKSNISVSVTKGEASGIVSDCDVTIKTTQRYPLGTLNISAYSDDISKYIYGIQVNGNLFIDSGKVNISLDSFRNYTYGIDVIDGNLVIGNKDITAKLNVVADTALQCQSGLTDIGHIIVGEKAEVDVKSIDQTKGSPTVYTTNNLYVNSGILKVNNVQDSSAIYVGNKLVVEGTPLITASGKNAGWPAIVSVIEPDLSNMDKKMMILGNDSGTFFPFSPLKIDCDETFSDSYYFYSGDNNAKYVGFFLYSPVQPDPEKKDESCEKVIGPTWHWNNTKGVCEDTGVVGTYTK